MKSTVLAILAFSSAKVSSVSACFGTSTPARRATSPLAVSQAICTWRFIGNMSGKSRQWGKTVGSIFFASAWACALSRIAERFLSVLTKRGVLAWYMEMFMGTFRIERCAHSTARRAAKARGRRPRAPIPYILRTNYFTSCAKMTMRPAMDTNQAKVRSQMIPATKITAYATRAQMKICAPSKVMSLVLPATTATSTTAAKSTRFSSMLRCARAARPPQPVSSGQPSRLLASLAKPTWLNAPCTATSICTTVNATAHTNRFSSGFIAPPCCWTAAAMVRRFSRRRRALRDQIADAERDVLAGERRKIEIDAQHLLRPVGRLESERKGHAELGAGDRQIGPRDLGFPRSLDRAAEVVLGLPVGALGGLNGFEARVVRVGVALGIDVCADLQSVAADEIAALGAREFQQALHGRLEFRAQGNVLYRILEHGQVRHEPGVLALLEFRDIRAVTRDQPGEHLAARVLPRQLGGAGREIIALHQVGVGVDRAKRLGLGLDSLHAYQRARLVEHRDDPGEHASRERLDRHTARHLAVDLDDVRLQPPDAIEVRVSRAEIVDHDEAAELAVVLDRANQARFVLERRLDQLDRHPVRRKTVRLQHPQEEGAVPETLGGDLRIDVEKQPAARVAEPLEVPDMEGPALAVETYPLLALRRLAEQLQRLDVSSAREMDRANQAFVTDGTAMSETVDRLEMARQTELVSLAPFPLRVVLVEKKRRSKIHHVHRAPAILRNSRYRQKYAEYAI